jgi:hypothetical protein
MSHVRIDMPKRVEFPLFPTAPQPEIRLTDVKHRMFDLIERSQNLRGDHMLDQHDDRTITALVDEVLDALHTNLAEHQEIVEEARAGYIEKCKAALEKAEAKIAKRREKLAKGEAITMRPISFDLQPPEDHSRDFRTAIKMMELHKTAHEADPQKCQTQTTKDGPFVKVPATFELKAVDVQRFLMNDWSWMDRFLTTNSAYSEKAAMLFDSRA